MTTATLTDAQHRALKLLAARPNDLFRPYGVSSTTLHKLRDKGLVDIQERPMTTVAQITAAGQEVVA